MSELPEPQYRPTQGKLVSPKLIDPRKQLQLERLKKVLESAPKTSGPDGSNAPPHGPSPVRLRARDDDRDYSYPRRSATIRARKKQEQNWVVPVTLTVAVIAILLWLPVGLKVLQGSDSSAGSGSAAYLEWLSSNARNTVSSQMYPTVMRLTACVDSKSAACVCTARVSDVDAFAEEVQGRWNSAGAYAAAHSALSKTVADYQEILARRRSICPGGTNLEGLNTAIDHYGVDHNKFVDEMTKIEKGS